MREKTNPTAINNEDISCHSKITIKPKDIHVNNGVKTPQNYPILLVFPILRR
jgi:hypothetical protein